MRGEIEPPPGQPGPPGETDDQQSLTGSTLWEIALEETSRRARAVGSTTPRVRRTFPLWLTGGTGVVGLVVVALLWAQAGPHPSAAGPGGRRDPGTAVPAAAGGPVTTVVSSCTAQPVDPSPEVGGTTEIAVSHVPPGPAIIVTLMYPGGSERYSVPSHGTGTSYVPVAVNGPPADEVVEVLVSAGDSSCRTSFTPAASPSSSSSPSPTG
ncbi:MAG TPA: hypothetical protein VMF60_07360 [Acidimicrobiales bacterium]|nr:hypothetical protein [Acidimicrobiales bacterium]